MNRCIHYTHNQVRLARSHGQTKHVAVHKYSWRDKHTAMQTAAASVYLLDNAVILLPVPVKAQLADPLKVIGIGATNLAQLLNHISGMDLNGDQSHHLLHRPHVSAHVLQVSWSEWVSLIWVMQYTKLIQINATLRGCQGSRQVPDMPRCQCFHDSVITMPIANCHPPCCAQSW